MKKFYTALSIIALIAVLSFAIYWFIPKDSQTETTVGESIEAYWSDDNQTNYGLKVVDGTLTLNDKAFYGVGANFYNLFNNSFQSYRDTGEFNLAKAFEGLRVMAEYEIPVVRFNVMGFDRALWWNTSLRSGDTSIYVEHKEDYLTALKALADEAERLQVGLIPSFFWVISDIPDYYDEPINYIGNPESNTVSHMRQFTKDIVDTLKDSKSVWGFELGNELSLNADLPNWTDHTAGLPHWSTRTSRTIDDKITTDAVNYIYKVFAETVKANDTHNRMTASGNGEMRVSQYNQWKDGTWTADTDEQYNEISSYLNPTPMDTVTEHLYDASIFESRVQKLLDHASVNAKAAIIGEFGAIVQTGTQPPLDNQETWENLLDIVVSKKVPLSLVWNYTATGTSIEYSFNDSTEHGKAILQTVKAANSQFAKIKV